MQFKDILGQEELKQHLRRSIDNSRISHAQLFTGSAGHEGLALALAYVQYLNCTSRHDNDSCGECPSCRQIAALAHPDLHWIFPVNKQGKKSGEVVLCDDFLPQFRDIFERNNGCFSPQMWYNELNLGKTLQALISAKEADRIIEKLSLKSYEGGYKCVIVWLPESMNEEAANKLLKILEEPWEKTLFLLVSERSELLLQTIRSRTQEVNIPRLTVESLVEYATNGGCEGNHARQISRLANGDLLELKRLMDSDNGEAESESFRLFCSLMRLSYNDKHLELIEWAEEAAQLTREQQKALLRESSRLLRESYMLNAGLGSISYLWGEEESFCKRFSPFVNNENIEPMIAEIESATAQLSQNGNPTILFTHFALSISKMIKRLK